MKVVVTGGRDYEDRELVFIVLDRIHRETPISLLIHGACGWDRDRLPSRPGSESMQGADRWADEWAAARKVQFCRVPAAWSALGGKAGPIRNGEMLDMQPNIVLAFPGGRGTRNCVDQARRRKLYVEHAARTSDDAVKALQDDMRRNRAPVTHADKETRRG